jgi:Protein of unknown function (DUF4229)
VSPVLKYTLARMGLFVAVATILVVLPIGLNLFLRLAIAVLVSAALSWFLLKGMRDEVANRLAVAVGRRTDRRERLRSALAGDDEPPSSTPA